MATTSENRTTTEAPRGAAAADDDSDFDIIDQDEDVVLPEKKKNQNQQHRTVKSSSKNNTDKPAELYSNLSSDLKQQLMNDSNEILHGFHRNGRSLELMHSRTREILQDKTRTKLLLAVMPDKIGDGMEHKLMRAMYIKWGETVFSFLGKSKPQGEHMVFIKDIKSGNIYMPCCHDVKPVPEKQLMNHFKSCLVEKIDGSKCAFCNSTDLVNNNYTTVNTKFEHYIQNTHINSVYLVLDYTKIGLQMVDARICDSYLSARPFSNYFLKHEMSNFGYNGLVEFFKAHFPVQQVERTPFYSTLAMYKRLAVNRKKDFFKLPCTDCDTTFPTYTGFYLGKILKLDRVPCDCGEADAFALPIVKIDELVQTVSRLVTKDTANASKTMLMALFSSGNNTSSVGGADGLNIQGLDLDQLIKDISQTNKTITIVSGDVGTSCIINRNPTGPKTSIIPSLDLQDSMDTGQANNVGTNSVKGRAIATYKGRRIACNVTNRSGDYAIPGVRYYMNKHGADYSDQNLRADYSTELDHLMNRVTFVNDQVVASISGKLRVKFKKK